MMATRSRACGMFRNVYLAQGVAFSADSSVILVGNMVERNVQVLRWDGTSLTDRGERIPVNGGSAALRTTDRPSRPRQPQTRCRREGR
jgi:hypothetical protein